jgi:hypothetical protein
MSFERVDLRLLLDREGSGEPHRVTDPVTGATVEVMGQVAAGEVASYWDAENAWDLMAADSVRELRARPAAGQPEGPGPKVMEVRVSRRSGIAFGRKELRAGTSYYFGLDENGLLVTDLFLDSPDQVEALIRPPPATGLR